MNIFVVDLDPDVALRAGRWPDVCSEVPILQARTRCVEPLDRIAESLDDRTIV